jgi:hypothetical protein
VLDPDPRQEVAHKKEKISNFMCSEELDVLSGSAAGFS